MNRHSLLIPWLPWIVLLSSCSSPPKPPLVDESRKRPVNTTMAVELQTCRSDLANTRLGALESARAGEASRLALSETVRRQALFASGVQAAAAGQRNVLISVLFPFASTEVSIADPDAARLVGEAREAPLIVLRGRTDGVVDSIAESNVARRRARAVEDWLVRAGIGRERIRVTWQPVGDHAADNTTPGGRSLNRRVEIEIYRAAPVVADVPPSRAMASADEPMTTEPLQD